MHVRKLLQRYSLPPTDSLVCNPPEKLQWKHSVKEAVNNHWLELLKAEAEDKSTLSYLNLEKCSIMYDSPSLAMLQHRPSIHVSCKHESKAFSTEIPTVQ